MPAGVVLVAPRSTRSGGRVITVINDRPATKVLYYIEVALQGSTPYISDSGVENPAWLSLLDIATETPDSVIASLVVRFINSCMARLCLRMDVPSKRKHKTEFQEEFRFVFRVSLTWVMPPSCTCVGPSVLACMHTCQQFRGCPLNAAACAPCSRKKRHTPSGRLHQT